MKPPPAEKLCGWKALITSTITVRTGIAIFHQTAALLVSDSQRTPMMLIVAKIAISTAATT
jgi:hypothetical protein